MSESIDRSSIVAVIPAFNEVASIGEVVSGLVALGIRVRVVDNGSDDGTAGVARAAGADVIAEPRRGYGQACHSGCEDLPANCDWILFCDADGSDDLASVLRLVESAREFDFVLGNRRATASGLAALTPVQNFGNAFAGAMLRLLVGHRFHDLGPLRLIRRETYERLQMRDRGFGWTVEMQARAAQIGARIAEIPVPYHPRKAGESKISGNIVGSFKAGAIILSTLGRFAVDRWQIPLTVLAGALLLGGAALMVPQGSFRDPAAVPGFLFGAGVMSLGFFLSGSIHRIHVAAAVAVAVLARILLLPMEPGTDVWRYIWEGLIQNAGFNPYVLAPDSEGLMSLRTEWWPAINNASISAIYPPLTELIFRLFASLSPTVLAFKLLILAADLGVCAILWRSFGSRSLVYLWNPLVIYVFAGGAHYDSLFLLPVVAAWRVHEGGFSNRNTVLAALLLGLSFAIKYVSAPLLAFLVLETLRRSTLRRATLVAVIASIPFVLSLVAFWMPFGIHPLGSGAFGYYARSAEFLPRLVAEFWEKSHRMNALFIIPFVLAIGWRLAVTRRFAAFAEESYLATFLISPAIHAWYFTWAIPFAVATRNLGFRLIGVSGFIYFLLEYRQALRAAEWRQTWFEMWLMWLPLVLGFGWTRWRGRDSTNPGHPRPRVPVRVPSA